MPRFFFHLRNPKKSLVDCEGMMLRDADAARVEAVKAVQNFWLPAAGCVQDGWEDWCIDVSDQRGRRVFSMAFAEAGGAKPDLVERPPQRLSPVVVHFDIVRAKRQLASLEEEMQNLVARTSRLVHHNRSQANSLAALLCETQQLRRATQELLDRSRQQSLDGDNYLSNGPGSGDTAKLH